jgi:pSer/pThr/pTyr-binding forkhead associated (FHA) protein
MKASLLVTQGAHKGREIPISVSPFVIGRDPQCQLRPTSAMISRRHCALVLEPGKLVLRDFGSTNGTLVNDRRIQGDQELRNDDRLRLDTLVFVVRIDVGASITQGVAAPPQRSPAEIADDELVASVLRELEADHGPISSGIGANQKQQSMDETVLETGGLMPLDDSNEE